MEPAENKTFVYEFGRFVLNPAEKTLLVDGVPIHLPAKEFETLLLLVENNGKALSKEQMMSAVWQDAFVEEGNLATKVSRLRKLLKSKGGDLIETIPKHGYRFSADVRLVVPESMAPIIAERRTVKRIRLGFDNSDEIAPTPLALLPKRSRMGPGSIVGVGIIVLVFGLAIFWYWNREGRMQPSEIRSIAVLPLRSLTPSEEIDALGLGLTDSLITELGS